MEVELSHVNFAYESLSVFDNVCMRIEPGQITTVLGMSGSGKTTLLKIIAGLIHATGDVHFGGGVSSSHLFHTGQASMFMQKAFCFPWATVRENVEIGLRLTDSQDRLTMNSNSIRNLIKRVGLADWEACYPTELSAGMQARVGLARALVTRPKLLLIDEPFASLDPIWKSSLYTLLRDQVKLGTTIILVTHDLLETLALSNTIHVISKKRKTTVKIAEDITPLEMLYKEGADFSRIFSGQGVQKILGSILGVLNEN